MKKHSDFLLNRFSFSRNFLFVTYFQVYFSSLVGGTESIGAANGYFNLANVLSREPSNQKQALSLYHKCATCWLKIIQTEQLTLSEAEIGEIRDSQTSQFST